jgi:DNA-binding protein YbaB
MSSPFNEQLEYAMGALRAQQAKIQQVQRELRQAEFSMRSTDRMVTATVRAQGDLTDLTFHTSEYRSMAPAQLSAAVVEVVAAAQQRATEKVAERFRPFRGAGARLRESMTGGSEFERWFEPLRAMRPPDPDTGQTEEGF